MFLCVLLISVRSARWNKISPERRPLESTLLCVHPNWLVRSSVCLSVCPPRTLLPGKTRRRTKNRCERSPGVGLIEVPILRCQQLEGQDQSCKTLGGRPHNTSTLG